MSEMVNYDPARQIVSRTRVNDAYVFMGDGANVHTYDVENRLIAVSGARTASLIYDPQSRLFETSDAPLGGSDLVKADGDNL